VASVAAHVHQAHAAQNAEMLGDGWLVKLEVGDDIADGALVQRQVAEDCASAGLGYCVEGVGGGCCSCHELNNTYLYGNMSSDSIYEKTNGGSLTLLIVRRYNYVYTECSDALDLGR
jgi:hypothetical protein